MDNDSQIIRTRDSSNRDQVYYHVPQGDLTPREIESLRDQYQPSLHFDMDDLTNRATKSYKTNNNLLKKGKGKRKKRLKKKNKKKSKSRVRKKKETVVGSSKLNAPYKNHPHQFLVLNSNSREIKKQLIPIKNEKIEDFSGITARITRTKKKKEKDEKWRFVQKDRESS